jgi:hypothetical protein
MTLLFRHVVTEQVMRVLILYTRSTGYFVQYAGAYAPYGNDTRVSYDAIFIKLVVAVRIICVQKQ